MAHSSFTFLRMIEVIVITGKYKTCKFPVKSSSPTNQHPVFTGRMPFLSSIQHHQSIGGTRSINDGQSQIANRDRL